jgi:hypothetical protein
MADEDPDPYPCLKRDQHFYQQFQISSSRYENGVAELGISRESLRETTTTYSSEVGRLVGRCLVGWLVQPASVPVAVPGALERA